MQTITDIRFNNNLYSQADQWVLILYHTEGVALAVPLSYIDLLTFLQPFNNIPGCQDHITTNNNKTFTLFTYSDNIETWMWNNNLIPDHLDEIIIFCPFADDKDYFKKWTRRYTQKVKSLVTFNELEREALIFGMKHIDDLLLHFQNNDNISNELNNNYINICSALSNSFGQAAGGQ